MQWIFFLIPDQLDIYTNRLHTLSIVYSACPPLIVRTLFNCIFICNIAFHHSTLSQQVLS